MEQELLIKILETNEQTQQMVRGLADKVTVMGEDITQIKQEQAVMKQDIAEIKTQAISPSTSRLALRSKTPFCRASSPKDNRFLQFALWRMTCASASLPPNAPIRIWKQRVFWRPCKGRAPLLLVVTKTSYAKTDFARLKSICKLPLSRGSPLVLMAKSWLPCYRHCLRANRRAVWKTSFALSD